jgi:rubredoxin
LEAINIGGQKEDKSMDRYECTICGYVYDPAEGDPENGINPGTAFEDLPDDWFCPECGAGKEDFEKLE